MMTTLKTSFSFLCDSPTLRFSFFSSSLNHQPTSKHGNPFRRKRYQGILHARASNNYNNGRQLFTKRPAQTYTRSTTSTTHCDLTTTEDKMELYSFQYPPRPLPSQTHRPKRYYFHNLDQDQQLVRKAGGPHSLFQKEGVPPTIVSKVAMRTDTAVVARMMSPSAFGGEDGVRSEEDIRAKVEVDGGRVGSGGLKVLDRTKFLVD